MGPSLNSLSRFSENLRKSSYKIEEKNCEIFFTYYFSYVRDYKAVLRGGNNFHDKIINFKEEKKEKG